MRQTHTENSHKFSCKTFTIVVRESVISFIYKIPQNEKVTQKNKNFQRSLRTYLSLLAENNADDFISLLNLLDMGKDAATKNALEEMCSQERIVPLAQRKISDRVWKVIDQKLS